MSAFAICLLAAFASSQAASPQGSVKGEVRVERVVVDAYVTDTKDEPIPDLDVADFRVRVEGREVEVESAEWIPAGQPEVVPLPPEETAGPPEGPASLAWPPGRVLVIFVQGDIGRYRTKGLMRMGVELDRFLATLLPTDRVAVVSFDSHLKLRRDFTADPREIRAGFRESLAFDEPAPLPAAPFPSLASTFDFGAARKAAFVDGAMALVARALAPIPGAKAMLFFGWGFRVDRGPKEDRLHQEALAALYDARVNVFTLDIADADTHTLETELMHVSGITGGTYEKTHLFTGAALARVSRRLAGRYVIVFVKPDGPHGLHPIETELVGRRGRVSARTYYVD